jgi:4-hydroxybenzoate polyprenyltransferase/phosphoserine phosphatase
VIDFAWSPGLPPLSQFSSPASTLQSGESPRVPSGTVPLCVDLDGTLVKSDTLVDSVLALVRQNPRALASLPGWLAQGKAAFKRHVTSAATIDVANLPYNQPLLEFLFREHAAGRELYLATAADRALAERVAAHHGIFKGVLASDGSHNLAGDNKLQAFRQTFGEQFSYIGNARPDLPILRGCQEPMVANPDAALMKGLRAANVIPAAIFRDQVTGLKAWLKAIRLHQWAKNALIFLPLLLAHSWKDPLALGKGLGALIAFFAFGLCASATYIVNDLLDIEADRRHHSKRKRPFAAGNLSPISGVVLLASFLAASVGLMLLLPLAVERTGLTLGSWYGPLAWLGVYAVTTTAYSFVLKRVVLVDVIVLSLLYTIRIFAGASASGVPVSHWLGGFSIFFFLSLALVKRFAELEGLKLRDKAPSNGRGYLLSDVEQLRTFGTSAAYASVVVLMLYISNLDTHLYRHAWRLWLLLPVFLLWVMQLWLLASRGELNEDPVVYAITDKRSLLLGVLVAAIVAAAV